MWFRKLDSDEAVTTKKEEVAGFWSALWTIFIIVFVAEWGDLTQIGTAGFEAKYQAGLTSSWRPAWRCGPWQRSPCSSVIGRASSLIQRLRSALQQLFLRSSVRCSLWDASSVNSEVASVSPKLTR